MSESPEKIASRYDAIVIGAGHNGLVAACYLAGAGLSVLILEKNREIGGATRSARIFDELDARLSIYAYLISLFPRKIADDLGLKLDLRRRGTASYTPRIAGGGETVEELLISNTSSERTRDSFVRLTGNDRDYRAYLEWQDRQTRLARVIWPTLTEPLPSRSELTAKLSTPEEKAAWKSLIEEPLGTAIEASIEHDLIRGLLFTDAKIGVSTWPDDPSLLQNRTFLYHVIGRGTGEWMTPAGGMGTLADQLEQLARKHGVRIVTDAEVDGVAPGRKESTVRFSNGDAGMVEVDGRYLLCNAAPSRIPGILPSAGGSPAEDEGAAFKINLLVKKLPRPRSNRVSAEEAFTGTFHVDEGYERMTENYHRSRAGVFPENPAFEIYCHSLTDDSILSAELSAGGYQTLTCFGLDVPYPLFESDNESRRTQLLESVWRGLNRYLAEPIEDCLARSSNGDPCVEIKTPVDLEREVHLPRGNIFHNNLSWPFADGDPEPGAEAGQWGVETGHDRIFLCGSGARRGGCVSGIPGHNAARKVLECEQGNRRAPW